ncbi:MAG: MerR family transcriptional regulator [Gemmatimonadota bacterium]|nr:MAG: MerR family transcriptional regulator [Gemmatimonadota bacterium]
MIANEAELHRKRHPIQVVARRTGLTADVLRAWEKRYGVVEPGRSEGGRRLYSDDDIKRLRLLRRASESGRRISQVASLTTEKLSALVEEDDREQVAATVDSTAVAAEAAAPHLQASLDAVDRLDAKGLEAALNRALLTLSSATMIDGVAAPLMRQVGELWKNGKLRPAHEHLASAVVIRILGKLLEAAQPAGAAPVLVVATPARQAHEFGALFAAATAASEGWRVTYLGADLPAVDIAAAALQSEAAAVAVSVVPPLDERVTDELRILRRELPAVTPIIVGGSASNALKPVLEEIDAIQVATLDELRAKLAELA